MTITGVSVASSVSRIVPREDQTAQSDAGVEFDAIGPRGGGRGRIGRAVAADFQQNVMGHRRYVPWSSRPER